MKRIAALSDAEFAKDRNTFGDTVNVIGVQRPAEIVNYQSTGATPVVLAIGLAVGATLALALTLIASVRRRRRDLASKVTGLHGTPTRGRDRLAGFDHCHRRRRRRHSHRYRGRSGAVGSLRPRHQRRPAANGSGLADPRRRRHVPPREPRRRHPCPYCRSYPGRARAAIGVGTEHQWPDSKHASRPTNGNERHFILRPTQPEPPAAPAIGVGHETDGRMCEGKYGGEPNHRSRTSPHGCNSAPPASLGHSARICPASTRTVGRAAPLIGSSSHHSSSEPRWTVVNRGRCGPCSGHCHSWSR